ncbi:hypothetical protein TNCV_4220751 [Trichonephila clavipes]|nr:hypothetical protein TNCV_4220751 [Trichonephila clavipes]
MPSPLYTPYRASCKQMQSSGHGKTRYRSSSRLYHVSNFSRCLPPVSSGLFLLACWDSSKYECHSSSTIPSFGYWHDSFNTNSPKPAPLSRSLCLPTNDMWYVNSKATSNPQGVGKSAYEPKVK